MQSGSPDSLLDEFDELSNIGGMPIELGAAVR